MLYSIARDNVPGVTPDQDRIIYFVATAEDFRAPEFIASDGNAASALTTFFGSHEELQEKIDWKVISGRVWRNTDDDGDRMRRRSAEFLVHRFVAWTCIREIVVRTEGTRKAVVELLDTAQASHRPTVAVNPDWYFT